MLIHTQLDEATFQAEQAAGRKTTLDEAIDTANRSRFGNAAVICTTSGKAARAFQTRTFTLNERYLVFPRRRDAGSKTTDAVSVSIDGAVAVFFNGITPVETTTVPFRLVPDGGMVRLVTPILPDETLAQSQARAVRFARVLYPMLNTYIPK